MKRSSSRFLQTLTTLTLIAGTMCPVTANAAPSSSLQIQRAGSQAPQGGAATNFTGSVQITPLFQANDVSRLSGGSVTFEPGARTTWHTHPLGQTLIVTAGVGRVQHWGGPIEEIRPGDVVRIPSGIKHWHGAAPDSSMTHIALTEARDGQAVDWLEKVSDAQYLAGLTPQATAAPSSQTPAPVQALQPTQAQKLMGDIAPKLADLTDKVLFGDVWARPQLSRRDRSLATVSALIALNRPEQLRSHFALARQNGLTQEELIEVITQMAFYSGWPNAVTAVSVAREVFEQQ